MADRHADKTTVDHIIELRKERDDYRKVLEAVEAYCVDLEVFAEPYSHLHPSLKAVENILKKYKHA